MILPKPPRLFFIIISLVFFTHTLLAYFFNWDAYFYKRLQDALVIAIGTAVWTFSAIKILREEIYLPYLLGLAFSTIIVTTHILRAINGGLLC
ncbi:MAG: hypothetical protein WCL13_03940 [bacterium]